MADIVIYIQLNFHEGSNVFQTKLYEAHCVAAQFFYTYQMLMFATTYLQYLLNI